MNGEGETAPPMRSPDWLRPLPLGNALTLTNGGHLERLFFSEDLIAYRVARIPRPLPDIEDPMSDAADDSAHVRDGSNLDPHSRSSNVSESGIDCQGEAETTPATRALLQLLQLGPDTVIDQLCEGTPRDFMSECRAHVRESAYFIEDGRVAARVIARLASFACTFDGSAGARELAEEIETIVEESTAAILEEGVLGRNPRIATDPLTLRIGVVLGLDDDAAHSLIDLLNSFDFDDRHMLYHCIVEGMTPEAYARKFHEDARVVTVVLRNVAAMAIDSQG